MGALQAMENIYSVGVLDKNLRVFDIIMTTEHGTTYNAYLIRGQTKTVLVEAVKDRFCNELIENIEQICPPCDIDYVVMNHTEPDHSGCLSRVLELAPGATVLASATALGFLQQILGKPFKSQAVKDGDAVDIGGMTLTFMYLPMLHWPDTMFTYIPETGALFTCDCFGCHYADERVFNDLIGDEEAFTAAYKYYFDNILGPYVRPHLQNALNKIEGLAINFIGTGHGPVLRAGIGRYINMYRRWAATPPAHALKAAVVYVSSYGYTAALAGEIAQGLRAGGVRQVQMFDLVTGSMDDAKRAVAEADGILLGSPTLVGDALPPLYEVMIGLNPVIHRGKFAAAFGSYAWSGEAVHNITTRMNDLHLNLPLPGLRGRLKPTDADLAAARDFGQEFARHMLGAAGETAQ